MTDKITPATDEQVMNLKALPYDIGYTTDDVDGTRSAGGRLTRYSQDRLFIMSLIARIEADKFALDMVDAQLSILRSEKEAQQAEIEQWRNAVVRYFDMRDYHRPDAEREMKILLDHASKGESK